MKFYLTLFISIVILFPGSSFAASRFNLCLNQNTGKIIVKKRCKAKKGEIVFTGSTVLDLASSVAAQGAPGPQGTKGLKGDKGDPGLLNVAACNIRFGNNSGTEWLWTNASCGAGEFLLTHGLQLPLADQAFIQEDILLFYSGTSVPSGVEYATYSELAEGYYSVNVAAVCCPIE